MNDQAIDPIDFNLQINQFVQLEKFTFWLKWQQRVKVFRK